MGYNLRELLKYNNSSIVDMLRGKCATCKNFSMSYYDINGEKQGGHCSYHGTQRFDESCPKYDRTYLDDRSVVEGLKNIEIKSRYLVSIVCDILNLPLDHPYREAFKSIRDKYLIDTLDGRILLEQYETYGSMLAVVIRQEYNSTDRKEVMNVINKTIVPEFDKIMNCIIKNNIRSAILRYIVLIRKLMEKYGINYNSIDFAPLKTDNNSPVFSSLLALRKTNK